jgi:predicted ester cyclase
VSEQTKQLVRRYFEELDRTKASPVDLIGPGFTFQAAGFPAMDLESTKQFTQLFFGAFPDLTHPLDELIAEGDNVALRCRYEGTHTGEDFMGVPASGRHFSAVGAGVVRVLNGKVAEFWVSPDRTSIMQQIGAPPTDE